MQTKSPRSDCSLHTYTLSFLLKQLEVNSSLVINFKIFLPVAVVVVVILQINAIAQNLAFKAVPAIIKKINLHFTL